MRWPSQFRSPGRAAVALVVAAALAGCSIESVPVSGVVVDEDETPIAGAVVRLIEKRGFGRWGNLQQATTDAAGAFRLDLVPADEPGLNVKMSIARDGFRTCRTMIWNDRPLDLSGERRIVLVRLAPGEQDEAEPWSERFDLGWAVSGLGCALLLGAFGFGVWNYWPRPFMETSRILDPGAIIGSLVFGGVLLFMAGRMI